MGVLGRGDCDQGLESSHVVGGTGLRSVGRRGAGIVAGMQDIGGTLAVRRVVCIHVRTRVSSDGLRLGALGFHGTLLLFCHKASRSPNDHAIGVDDCRVRLGALGSRGCRYTIAGPGLFRRRTLSNVDRLASGSRTAIPSLTTIADTKVIIARLLRGVGVRWGFRRWRSLREVEGRERSTSAGSWRSVSRRCGFSNVKTVEVLMQTSFPDRV